MGIVLDEFFMDMFCEECKTQTEHSVTKEDEQANGQYIAYYAKCDVCESIEEVSKTMVEA